MSRIDVGVKREALSNKALAILDHIRQNEGQTNNMIANIMNDNAVCSRQTTFNEIANLKESNLIYSKRHHKPNNKTQYLFVNNQETFNRINDLISKVENISKSIIGMDNWLHDFVFEAEHTESSNSNKTDKILSHYLKLQRILSTMTTEMVQFLILKIGTSIKSEEKSQVLYMRIVQVLQQIGGKTAPDFSFDVNGLREEIKRTSEYKHDMNGEYISLLKQLVSISEEFASTEFGESKELK